MLYSLISLKIVGIFRGSSSKQYIVVEIVFLYPLIQNVDFGYDEHWGDRRFFSTNTFNVTDQIVDI